MAFCTKCGAQVTGSFCSQCGTPAASAVGEAGAPPPRRGMHPILVVLLVLVGVVVLGMAALVGTGLYVARHGGGLALAKMIAQANPNMEIVRTDDGAGTITLRDRRNGKEVTLTFDDARRNGIRFLAEDNGKSASVQFGGDARLPSWVPAYPGGHVEPVVAASGESGEGRAEGGNFTVNTGDDPAKVMAFYEDQARQAGMRVEVKEHRGERNVIVAKNEEDRREFTAVVMPHFGGTTVNVTYKRER
jgi:hypothetical protein